MKKNQQSNRLTMQQKEGQGPITIFHEDAQIHDKEVGNTSLVVKKWLELEYPMLKFRYRKELSKKEIIKNLKKVDDYLGQTLFVKSARIIPDGGLIEVQDDKENWRVVLVSEAKHQGKDIENIKAGKLVGKKNDQDLMAAGNAIERAYKNVDEIENFMLAERYFPYILFLEGSNFLTQNVTVTRPDGRQVTLVYNDGMLNRLDRLTASNYGMPINTNLCENKFVKCNGAIIMLQAASIYTKGDGGHWNDEDMIMVMLDVARTSLRMLGSDLFAQLSKR
jgi:type II restriction enzyme